MLIFAYFILFIYCFLLSILLLYSFTELNLLFNYFKSKKVDNIAPQWDFTDVSQIPLVTIQLPIYNEEYVIERLLKCITSLQYPIEKLEIQILDDSTDQSSQIIKKWVDEYKNQGFFISHIQRQSRQGFKAGALKYGLEIAKSEYIVIFDADFLPHSDWLFQTIPYFKNENIGVVQARWGHLNRNLSLLTQIQAFALDIHFSLDQKGRNFNKHFINFNGTAGVWRKKCILDAGNWEADTLTEDLDLSYRAQLRNWEFIYLENVETPAQLPICISAAKTQQFRWNKGGAENLRKLLSLVRNSNKMGFKSKIHAYLHLMNSSMFVVVFSVSLLTIPILIAKNIFPQLNIYFDYMGVFILSSLLLFYCYWFVYQAYQGKGWVSFINYIVLFVSFFSVALAFSFQNSIAVFEGLRGKKSEFVRTPKFSMDGLKGKWNENKYITRTISKMILTELALLFYFISGCVLSFYFNDYSLLTFFVLACFGYSYSIFHSIRS
jgi:cellulose synthase/poly-beta-1,6-N-acetylglucosamine synthase-like glycosyltransferase